MKISKQSFFLITLVIAGCQSNITQMGKQNQSDTIKSERKKDVKKSFPLLNCDSTIINNEFSFHVLAIEVFKADTAKIKSLFLNPVILKFEKQKNSEGSSYDLYNFTDGINKLTLHRNEGFYLDEADRKNEKVLLNRKTSIGMAKNVFLKLVKVSI